MAERAAAAKRRGAGRWAPLILVAVAGAALFTPASPAGAVVQRASAGAVPPDPSLNCGDTVTASARLTKDLVACPGDGLVIGAPDVVLDLAGHTISSDPKSEFVAGVRVAGEANTTVRGGRIKGFNSDVLLSEAPAARVNRMTLVGAQFAGLATGVENGATVRHNVFRQNVIAINTDDSSNIRIGHNLVRGGAFGISLGNGSDLSVNWNLLGNQEFRGILVPSGATDAALTQNVVHDSGGDGIVVNNATATLSWNQARRNAGDGIAAVDGVAGGHNSATKNGGVDCAPAYLCSN